MCISVYRCRTKSIRSWCVVVEAIWLGNRDRGKQFSKSFSRTENLLKDEPNILCVSILVTEIWFTDWPLVSKEGLKLEFSFSVEK